MTPKKKVSIEQPRIPGIVRITGGVQIEGKEFRLYSYIASATREGIETILGTEITTKNEHFSSQPYTVYLASEYAVPVYFMREPRGMIREQTRILQRDMGIVPTPEEFEKRLWNVIEEYMGGHEFNLRVARIQKEGLNIDEVIQQIRALPPELDKAHREGKQKREKDISNAIMHIGHILGCPRTACNLICLVTTTEKNMRELYKNTPPPYDAGTPEVMWRAQYNNEEFLKIRTTKQYQKLYTALLNKHIDRIHALAKGDYEGYAKRRHEIEHLFDILNNAGLEQERQEKTWTPAKDNE